MVGGLKSSPTTPTLTPTQALPDTVAEGGDCCTKSPGHTGSVQGQSISTSTAELTISFDNLIKYLSQPPDYITQEDKNPALFILNSQPLAQCQECGR